MKTKHGLCGAIIALGLTLVGNGSAQATLLGDTVSVTTSNNLGGNMVVLDPVVQDPGVEFQMDFGAAPNDMDLDFDGTGITITATTSAGGGNGRFLSYTLSSLEWTNFANGEIVDTVTSGFLRSDVSTVVTVLDGHTVQVDFASTGTGFGWVNGNAVRIDFVVNHIPEPGSLALFALALGGLGFMMRRRVA